MTAAEEKRLNEWQQKERTVTLTNGQWSSLTMYLQMSSEYRKRQKKLFEEMEAELDENGNPKFRHAASNKKFWEGMIGTIKDIQRKIEKGSPNE